MPASGQHNYFKQTKKLYIEEIKATLLEYEHIKTKAHVIHLQNDDPENLFVISFPTYPTSSNGVFHILEHTVLCGSQKYPVKDPFFSMLRRSLATFMNAMTGMDFTCYPASSQIEKDFYQLFEVYLDATFHPLLKELSFLQEGWRLEYTDPKNPASLTYKGIVFNEMKGARSSIDERLYHTMLKNLTPDLPYSYETGGLPEEIPSLSYEELLAQHQKFYHPSHAIFFFYGNLPTEKHLSFLEEKCLKDFSHQSPLEGLPKQKRFSKPKTVTAYYPSSEAAEADQKAILSIGALTCPIQNQTEVLALALLDHILFATDASLISKPLLESGLCLEVYSSLNLEMSEIPWLVFIRGLEEHKKTKILEIFQTTLKEIIKNQIPSALIDAALHQLEFSRSEIVRQNAPYGLNLFFQAALAKHHGIAVEKGLQIHTLFDELKAKLETPGFLTGLLQKYFLDNPHQIILTMLPDEKLHQKEQEIEQKKLLQKAETLTALEKQKILENTKKLSDFQTLTPDLSCLPNFPIDQIPHPVINFPLIEKKLPSCTLFHHSAFTNQIFYAELLFDLPQLSIEEILYLSLFSSLLPQVGCHKRNYSDNLNFISAHLGEFSAFATLNSQAKDPSQLNPTFSLKAKALKRKIPFLLQIFQEMSQSADFSDKKRIKELLLNQASLLENSLAQQALSYSMKEAVANINIHHFLNNQMAGLPYFQFIQKIKKELKQNLDLTIQELQKIQTKVFAQNKPTLIITAQQDIMPEDQLFNVLTAEKTSNKPVWQNPPCQFAKRSSAKAIPAAVAFNSYALKAPSYLDKSSPYLLLSTFLMENLYLHPEIREKGGAYGSGANFHHGAFYFYSYRDPQIQNTFEAFKNAIQKIADGHFSKANLEEAVRGAIRGIEEPVSPGMKGEISFFFQKTGRSKEARQKFKDALLTASPEDVSQAVKKHLLNQSGFFTSYAEQKLLQEKLPPGISIEKLV